MTTWIRSRTGVPNEESDTSALSWNVLGLRLVETDGTTVRSVNQKFGTTYRVQ